MQIKRHPLAGIVKTVASALFGFVLLGQVLAADPTGTWTWSAPGRQGAEPRKTTLKLKAEGEKLTGKIASPARQGAEARETEISDGKIKGDEISFAVVREFNGNKMTQKFSGKVEGDTIKGKIEFDRNGQTQSRDWEAKKEPAK
jgi:hypothetical protein